MSPGATVRFAKATVHRVEVGPGRRFAPVKRKSKSTITYIAPLDTGTQKSTPKGILTSPTKLRRHVENQKAMGRYWMRTEEEEAQERAEAEMKAVEEARRYQAEPASPPGPSVLANSPAFHGFSWADGLEALELDKLPPVDNLPSLDNLETDEVVDRLETEVSDSDDDSDIESGAKLYQDEEDDDEKVEGGRTNDSTKPESQPQGGGRLIPVPSTEVKTGAGIQEVKNTTAPVTTATQEAKTAMSRPAIETSPPPSLPKTPSSTVPAAKKNPANPVQNSATVNPKASETPMQKQPEAKKTTTATAAATKPTTETKSAAHGNLTAKPPLIKATTTAPPSPLNKNQTPPTLIITPSSPPPRRTLSPSPPRRSFPPMAMTLRQTTSIYINNTGATVSGEKQRTTSTSSPPPARSTASHLRLSGRRGRRFDTTPTVSDHGKQGHEITA